MHIINVTQGTDPWLQWRAQGITASDMPIVLGVSPYKTPYQLWCEKTGRVEPEDLSNNPHVQRGRRKEDQARQHVEEVINDILLPVCGEHQEQRFLRASCDGIDSESHPYELKCPCASVFQEVIDKRESSEAYQLYKPQVETQIVVTGATEGFLVFWRENENAEKEMAFFRIMVSEERAAEIIAAATHFWHLIKTHTEPQKDPERDVFSLSGDQLTAWEAEATPWLALDAQITVLEQQAKQLKQQKASHESYFAQHMGANCFVNAGGIEVSRSVRSGTIEYKKFLEETFSGQFTDEALEEYRKPPSSTFRVKPAKVVPTKQKPASRSVSKKQRTKKVAVKEKSIPLEDTSPFPLHEANAVSNMFW